jgi:hypothetical protein
MTKEQHAKRLKNELIKLDINFKDIDIVINKINPKDGSVMDFKIIKKK